jgi:hypothetical protein
MSTNGSEATERLVPTLVVALIYGREFRVTPERNLVGVRKGHDIGTIDTVSERKRTHS